MCGWKQRQLTQMHTAILPLPAATLSVLQTAKDVVSQVVQQLGHVDILVNNASEQHMAASLADVTPEELVKTFQTNIFGYYYFAQVQQQQLQHARVPQ
jgi:NAD(P)-dependent dehydrogenase (short-subunit alcohol dehydrogenase family)